MKFINCSFKCVCCQKFRTAVKDESIKRSRPPIYYKLPLSGIVRSGQLFHCNQWLYMKTNLPSSYLSFQCPRVFVKQWTWFHYPVEYLVKVLDIETRILSNRPIMPLAESRCKITIANPREMQFENQVLCLGKRSFEGMEGRISLSFGNLIPL